MLIDRVEPDITQFSSDVRMAHHSPATGSTRIAYPRKVGTLARQIALARLANFILRYGKDITNKRCPRGSERIAVAPWLTKRLAR